MSKILYCVDVRKNDKKDMFIQTQETPNPNAVKNFYKFLEKHYSLACHAIFSVTSPKKAKKLPKALSIEQTEISRDHIDDLEEDEWIAARNRALLTLLYAAGLRISEALSITKNHLKNKEALRVVGKGSKERSIPWIESALELIERYLKLLPYDLGADQPIFLGKRGAPLQRAVFGRELIALRRRYNLPEHLTPHAFRHSFATHLLDQGADLRSIQELLGHASLSTTQTYTKITDSHLKKSYLAAHPMSKK